jgi:putative pyruvate formate lyase activating enzyme
MVRQCPEPVFADGSHSLDAEDDKDDPMMVRGVIVRHLALPGCGEDSRDVLDYLHGTYGDRIFISLLNQYTPMEETLREKYPELCRRVTEYEYHSLVEYAVQLGVTRGFVQEGTAAEESFIPAFDLTGV